MYGNNRLLRSIGLVVLAMLVSSAGFAVDICHIPTSGSCTGMGATRVCKDSVSNTLNTATVTNLMVGIANNAACNTNNVMAGMYYVTFTASATNAATPRTCSWFTTQINPGTTPRQICLINVADGLPVELMEFSVEDDGS